MTTYPEFEGKKILSLNKDYYESNGVKKYDYVVHQIEGVGENWIVTKGTRLHFTCENNAFEIVKVCLTDTGEIGSPLSEKQLIQLKEVKNKHDTKNTAWFNNLNMFTTLIFISSFVFAVNNTTNSSFKLSFKGYILRIYEINKSCKIV